jgi:hypothetical protein
VSKGLGTNVTALGLFQGSTAGKAFVAGFEKHVFRQPDIQIDPEREAKP